VEVFAGRLPPGNDAIGVYGTSRYRAASAVVVAAYLCVTDLLNPPPWAYGRTTSTVALGLLVAIYMSVVLLTPALVITDRAISRRFRRFRRPIGWNEVAEILPPGFGGRYLRVRLSDRTVLTLDRVSPKRLAALTALLRSTRVS
jgi:hypothetical protein